MNADGQSAATREKEQLHPAARTLTWTSPSDGDGGTMPTGNGSTAVNVWVEADGVLRFYVARADAFDGWRDERSQIFRAYEQPDADPRAGHEAWWRSFWQRSFVSVSGSDDAAAMNLGYNLQRLLIACAGLGIYPIKFNGSLFTGSGREVQDPSQRTYDPDHRRWGGHYWHQNSRLPYWGMLATGDHEMMPPFFDLYRRQLPLAKHRAERYDGVPGAVFPETMTLFGTFAGDNDGWDREGRQPGETESEHMRLHTCGALETAAMRVEYHRNTQNDAHAALLGLTEEAARGVTERFGTMDKSSRFPAFWGPNCNWIPDQDHGSVGVIVVNFMLLQTVEDKLYSLPAWPLQCDVACKLHAPRRTTVELRLEGGALTRLQVTPQDRRGDVVLPPGLNEKVGGHEEVRHGCTRLPSPRRPNAFRLGLRSHSPAAVVA